MPYSGDGMVNSIITPNTMGQPDIQRLDGRFQYSASFWSLPCLVQYEDTVGIHFSCPATGTPNGTFAIQGSSDKSQYEGNPNGGPNGQPVDGNLLHWATLSFWDEATGAWVQSKAVSGASSYMFTFPITSARWVRMSWTNTSGSITPFAVLTVKSDGGS